MKKHADLTVEGILAEILQQAEPQVTRVDGGGTPEELMEATLAMKAAFGDFANKVMTICVGCSTHVKMAQTSPCACGGFVCQPCEELEEDGVCNHDTSHVDHLREADE